MSAGDAGHVDTAGSGRALRVGWCTTTTHCSDLLFYTPQMLRPEIACPAISQWLTRSFLIRAPYDVELHFERNAHGAALRWGEHAPQSDVYASFALAAPALWPAPDTPVVFWDLRNLFVAEEPVSIETLAPFLHREFTHWPGSLLPQRVRADRALKPLNWPFVWDEPSRPLIVRRGDPLQYVRVHPARADAVVRVERIAYSAAIARALEAGGGVTPGLLPAREAARVDD